MKKILDGCFNLTQRPINLEYTNVTTTIIINGSLVDTFELCEEFTKLFSRIGNKLEMSAFLLLKCVEGAMNNTKYFVFCVK